MMARALDRAAPPAGAMMQRRCASGCEAEHVAGNFGRDFSHVRVHANSGAGAGAGGAAGAAGGAPTAPKPAEKGAAPCMRNAWLVETRTVDLQPVFFKDSPTDAKPTGGSFATWAAKANEIWGKLAVTFNTLSPVVLEDAVNKTKGKNDAELIAILGLHSGPGVEVFMVDNPMAPDAGGGGTDSTNKRMVLSDQARSDTLLAHELGHILGLGHPPGGGDANSIMMPSNSKDSRNSERNTIGNYNRITWPAGENLTCVKPDP